MGEGVVGKWVGRRIARRQGRGEVGRVREGMTSCCDKWLAERGKRRDNGRGAESLWSETQGDGDRGGGGGLMGVGGGEKRGGWGVWGD